MKVHTLVVEDGHLSFPTGGPDGGTSILMRFYEAGDMDTCPWPFEPKDKDLRHRLAIALYDERESNSTFGVRDTVVLPDGQPFDFDAVLEQ